VTSTLIVAAPLPPPHSSAFRHSSGGNTKPTTPPLGAQKRKHEDPAEQTPAAISSTLAAEQQPARKASKTFHIAGAAALPATPLSSNGNMDSDIEDFNSVASSDDFGEDAGSSLGGGKFPQSSQHEGRRGGGVVADIDQTIRMSSLTTTLETMRHSRHKTRI